ncbi:ribosome-recycling factor [Candidatus Photodesmus katoptron]|uniref:Ribosome-recycling factor n=1 Tax=Candidatus Photodesmus katoptron Akat1 TaxID=1236703 RepID=S3DHL5_9GAMM|nr:ribosome recycling factor [Candidatus Photodesmus katoptron]EPE37927.1 ribosome recycling factor [Candidatus Photodesmus katoptron Akat1]KEY90353.1 ribosome-recycling factor [Candidatus Photodesmus katoptron]
MIFNIKNNAKERMNKSIEVLKNNLTKIRTGRVQPSILFGISVEYYGSVTPLNQIANIIAEDACTLAITVFNKGLVSKVEKAILQSDLGLNPMSSGTVIRVPIPTLTKERRKNLVKIVRVEIESGRVAIRNIRRDANSELKILLQDKKISKDEERRGQDEIQNITNKSIKEIELILVKKETELTEF